MLKHISLIDTQELQAIVSIEATAYPPHMQYMQGISSIEDLIDYCEGDVSYILTGYWYLLVTEEEVVDLATDSSLTLRDMVNITKALRSFYGKKPFCLDARESTSFKLIGTLTKRGDIKIHHSSPWMWEAQSGALILDSLEGPDDRDVEDHTIELVKQFVCDHHNVAVANTGYGYTSRLVSELRFHRESLVESPAAYTHYNYTDAVVGVSIRKDMAHLFEWSEDFVEAVAYRVELPESMHVEDDVPF